jgi:biopolymer transport protein ExbB
MDAKRRLLQVCSVALVSANTFAQSEDSFGEVFFVSKSSDGSIELIGSSVTWLLLLLSMFSIGLMVHLALANRRPTILPSSLSEGLRKQIKKKHFQNAISLAERDDSYLGKILVAAFKEAKFGFPAMMRALEQTADELATSRLRRIELLNVFGQVSPMIGLFGTVYGMILAFGAIVASGGSADPVALAGGIGTALTTTFWGLVVAIPALSGYAILRNKIDALTVEATIDAEDILNNFRPRPRSKQEQVLPTSQNDAKNAVVQQTVEAT